MNPGHQMTIMPADNLKWQVHYWQGKYGGLGHLYSLGGNLGPYEHLPHALDNGRYPCWASGKEWDENAYMKFLNHHKTAADSGHRLPLWALVPDVVADKNATIDQWERWSPIVRDILPGVPLAFACQDGMTPDDIPNDADVAFIGGSNDFKAGAIELFCKEFPRVHVGRINGLRGLLKCWQAEAESCDGTGWFRREPWRIRQLEGFIAEQAAGMLCRYGVQQSFIDTVAPNPEPTEED